MVHMYASFAAAMPQLILYCGSAQNFMFVALSYRQESPLSDSNFSEMYRLHY